MLIETPYKNGDTVSLKLSSGEEIVGRLEEETPTKFVWAFLLLIKFAIIMPILLLASIPINQIILFYNLYASP